MGMDSIINRVANGQPPSDHTITFYQTGGQVRLGLDELDRLARRVARHLIRLGVGAGSRIGIMSKNRLEWVLLDLAALKIKAVTAGFEVGKFAAHDELIDRYGLQLIFTDRFSDDAGVMPDRRIVPVDKLLAAIADIPEEVDLEPVVHDPGEITTIKFTSGSTGQPKGLAATVGSIDSSVAAVQSLFHHSLQDKLFVFLPLSLLQQRYWIYSALAFGHDVGVATYELAFHALQREQPTVVMGVPGFFETLRKEISARIAREANGGGDSDGTAIRRRCARSVLGARIRYLWTGSAPANPDLLRFFESCDMPIFEGYGMNETCIVTKNTPEAHKLGSVGRPLPGKHISLDENGVVIVRSDFPVNTRYLFSAPGDSERIFLADGAVRTGDLGRIDEEGFLYILGRADDLVVLENGRNILVRPLEERLRTCPEVDDCIIVGSGFSHLYAIVCASGNAAVSAKIEKHIAAINGEAGNDEKIGGFVLAAEPFSIENGLLTSQYKPRRKEIFMRYARDIERADGDGW
jgi:long-chain acyl-CoA synthetase